MIKKLIASNYWSHYIPNYVHGIAMTSLQWRRFIGTNNILSVGHKNCDFIGDRKIVSGLCRRSIGHVMKMEHRDTGCCDKW